MPTDFRIISIPEPPCPHKLPNWRERRRQKIKPGTVIECFMCGRRFVWGGDMYGPYWENHYN